MWFETQAKAPEPPVATYGTLTFKLETDDQGHQWVSVFLGQEKQLGFELGHHMQEVAFSVDMHDLHHIKANLQVQDEVQGNPTFSFALRDGIS
ncbi:MAG: hypothetical protein H6510_07750 [Acidobacteria bacterium]|nr:hypothetical protein [Acidobacteriota bacterium]MCB9397691.1 hypothetical protein [Acidobacteriota bacterium]